MAQNSTYQLAPTQTYQAPTTVGLSNAKQPSYTEWMHAANAGSAFQWLQGKKDDSDGGFGTMWPLALLGLAAPYVGKFIDQLNQAQQLQQTGKQLERTFGPAYRRFKAFGGNLLSGRFFSGRLFGGGRAPNRPQPLPAPPAPPAPQAQQPAQPLPATGTGAQK